MVWAVRVDRDKNTSEIKRVKVVDMDDLHVDIIGHNILKKLLRDLPNCICNLYLDANGKIRLREMSPYSKAKAYNTINTPMYKIQQFCIITGYNSGSISWLADTSSFKDNCAFDYTEGSTVDRLLELLNIQYLKDLKIYNGYFGDCNLFIHDGYNGREPKFRLCGSLISKNNPKSNNFDNSWEVQYKTDNHIIYMESLDGKGEYTIPEGIKVLEEFGGGVNNLTLPNSLVHLGDECFSTLEDLYTVKLGDNIEIIPESCFFGSSLEHIRFGANTKEICESAFEDCTRLKGNLIINAEKIGNKAFSGTNLTKVRLLDTKEIGIECFSYAFKLSEIKLGESLEIIRGGAFRNCSKLESIFIPSSCKIIQKRAFENTKLKVISLSRNTKVCDGALPKKCKVMYRD